MSNNSILTAYRTAVRDYKPWHQPHWDSPGRDSFPQIVQGGVRAQLYNDKSGASFFGVSEQVFQSWLQGNVPDRKDRKKVWKKLKVECGLQ